MTHRCEQRTAYGGQPGVFPSHKPGADVTQDGVQEEKDGHARTRHLLREFHLKGVGIITKTEEEKEFQPREKGRGKGGGRLTI